MKSSIFRILFFTVLLLSHFVLASGSGITYNGRLLDPSGNAVVSNNVQFRIQIRTPGNENCLMYEEIQTKDMTNSDGVFSITINDGTGSRTDSTGYTLDQLFANRGSFSFPASYCVTGTVYNTTPTDGRKLQVYFNDGSFATGQWEPTPSMAINFIPMAIESQQVGGYKKEQLLKIADGVSTTGTELDSTKWTNLLALINGTSTAYTKPTDQVTQLYGATVPTPSNGQSIRWNSALNAGAGGWENFTAGTASAVTTVSSANADIGVTNGSTTPQLTLNSGTAANQIVKLDGTAKLPAVDGSALTNVDASKVGGTTVSLASLTSGQVLKYNGTNWVNAADSDALGGLSCANGRVAYYSSSSWGCLEVTPSNTLNTIVTRDGVGLSNFGTVNTGTLKINDGAAGAISLITPVAVTSYSMRLPATSGSNGQVLTTDGGNPAQLSWSSGSSQWTTSSSDIYYNSGNVGIGTTSMNALDRLTVNDGTGGDAIVKVKSSGNNAFIKLDGYTIYDWEIATAGNNFALREYGNQGTTYIGAEGGLPSGSTAPIYIKSNGNVGIGTTSPANTLTVNAGATAAGGVLVTGTLAPAVTVSQSGNVAAELGAPTNNGQFSDISVTNDGVLRAQTSNLILTARNASGSIKFATGSADTEKMRISNAGYVGIGTSTPSYMLNVKNTGTGVSSYFESNCSGCGSWAFVNNAASTTGNSYSGVQFGVTGNVYGEVDGVATSAVNGAVIFKTNNGGAVAEKVRIDNVGNMGIGTASPGYGLHIYKTSAQMKLESTAGSSLMKLTKSAGASYQASVDFGTVGTLDFSAGTYGTSADFSIGPTLSTPYMTILKSSGNVGIGTTSPQTSLQVAGVISPATSNTYTLGDATYRFTEVYATNGVINTSDRREKKDIYDTDLGLAFINKLRPVSYRWNTGVDDDVHYGLIAQEAEQVLTDLGRNKKTSIVSHDEKTDRYGVRYSEIISPLIKAVQELYGKILGVEMQQSAQTREIASVKAENERLKQENASKSKEMAEMKARLERLEKAILNK